MPAGRIDSLAFFKLLVRGLQIRPNDPRTFITYTETLFSPLYTAEFTPKWLLIAPDRY